MLIAINVCTQLLSHELKMAEDAGVSLSIAKLYLNTHNLLASSMLLQTNKVWRERVVRL